MFLEEKMSFWLKNKLNVVFIGKHGVGKTARIKALFDKEYGPENWLYFSGGTMDPWVDFVGIPQKTTDEKTGATYLELILPKRMASGNIKAIFIDEFNRSHKKVRNALMELIQFRSINGRKFENLELVWTAINPDDDSEHRYDVEPMDDAQMDRFQIPVYIPYECDLNYFVGKFGNLGRIAVDWWDKLPVEEKNKVTPRRLDYALDLNKLGGSVRDVLPESSNTTKLHQMLSREETYKESLLRFVNKNDVAGAKQFINQANNYTHCIPDILKSKELKKFYLCLIKKENLISIISDEQQVEVLYDCINYAKENDYYLKVINEIKNANTNRPLIRTIENYIEKNNIKFFNPIDESWGSSPVKARNVVGNLSDVSKFVGIVESFIPISTQLERWNRFNQIVDKELPSSNLISVEKSLIDLLECMTASSLKETLDKNEEVYIGYINYLTENLAKEYNCTRKEVIQKHFNSHVVHAIESRQQNVKVTL